MRFKDYSIIADLYHDAISDGRNYNFEEVQNAIEDFENYILSLHLNCNASELEEIHSKALMMGSEMELQGFLFGMSNGMKMQNQADKLYRVISKGSE